MKTKNLALYLVALCSALALSGCGPKSETKAPASTTEASSAAKPAPAEGRAIEVTGNDTMKFNVVEMRAKPGEALAVTLKNIGTMPKMSMGHNWVLLDAGVDLNAFAADTGTAAKTDYVPPAYKSQILAATKLLGPGESDTVRFYAPTKPGRYIYLCSFPGHFQVGMKGVLIVE
jgi:azurin